MSGWTLDQWQERATKTVRATLERAAGPDFNVPRDHDLPYLPPVSGPNWFYIYMGGLSHKVIIETDDPR